MVLWMRSKEGVPIDASMLAIFADFVPSAGGGVRPSRWRESLDSPLRIARIVPTDRVLCDARISAAARGFGHGAIHMFAQDGTMIASGSQSAILPFAELT